MLISFVVSAPKLRKIVNKPMPTMKSFKEDVLKSQTYQQFMKTMENQLQRLEETEQPNNIGKIGGKIGIHI